VRPGLFDFQPTLAPTFRITAPERDERVVTTTDARIDLQTSLLAALAMTANPVTMRPLPFRQLAKNDPSGIT
jgi:hypothetical protein